MHRIIALAVTVAVAQTTLPTGLETPDNGVVCNRLQGICYDRYGASIGLTETFLGHVVAERLTIILRSGASHRPETHFSPAEGVECVRETGPCRLQRRLNAPLTAVLYRPMARPVGQTAEMRAIMYGEWDWKRTRYNKGIETSPSQPEHYVLRFEPDGHLEARVDCNSAGGNYRFEANRIALELVNSTLMSCEPGSLEEVFKQNLAAVGAYFMNGGRLFLDLRNGIATMEFDRPALHAPPGHDGQENMRKLQYEACASYSSRIVHLTHSD